MSGNTRGGSGDEFAPPFFFRVSQPQERTREQFKKANYTDTVGFVNYTPFETISDIGVDGAHAAQSRRALYYSMRTLTKQSCDALRRWCGRVHVLRLVTYSTV